MAHEELDKLGTELGKPAFRASFHQNHRKALEDAAIDITQIDGGVLASLTTLNPKELQVLSDVKGALETANVPEATRANMV